jgi:hypothetical protein
VTDEPYNPDYDPDDTYADDGSEEYPLIPYIRWYEPQDDYDTIDPEEAF